MVSTPIRITVGTVCVEAELNDGPTALEVVAALPIQATANTWGDEIYFAIPVRADLEPDATDVVELGDIGYWPPGSAFCIFYGKTPASTRDQIRAASAVSVIGRVLGDPAVLKATRDGTPVRVELASAQAQATC